MEGAKENKMGTTPILPLLISMSIPAMFSMLVQALYNIVDSLFVGQIGENAFTAVSLVFPIQNLLIAVSVGTGVGLNSLISRKLGERKPKEAGDVACHGLILAVFSWVAFLLFGLFFSKNFIRFFSQNPAILEMGSSYTWIVTVFSFGVFGSIAIEKILQGTGDMRHPMFIQLIGAIVNIVLDPILIFGFFGLPSMGVAGAAIATVIGQVVSLLYGAFVLVTKNHAVSIRFKGFRIKGAIVKSIYLVGFPSIIMQSIGAFLNICLNNILIGFSDAAVAVLGAYYKVQSFVFMPVFGLTNGAMPIMGYNYGARDKKRFMSCVKWTVVIAVGIMLVGMLLFLILPAMLLRMFNASDAMLSIGEPAFRIISLSFVFAGVGIALSTAFQAIGQGFRSLLISLMRQLVVILPIAWFASKTALGVTAVWIAFPVAEVVAFVLALLIFWQTYHKQIQLM